MRPDDPTLPPHSDPYAETHAPSEPRPTSTSKEVEPTRLGRYVVIERIGAGAMGVVYSAYDPKLDRKVAVKLLLPGRGGPAEQARLLREAQAMAQLSHPHVVAVHDVGEHEGRAYVAMDFVRGETLRAWLERERRSWKDVLAMFVQAGRGLAAAHEAGIVHRDFKPDNVLIGDKGRAMVSDFGLAVARATVDAEVEAAQTEPSGVVQAVLTRHGALVGTPAYMAPEQFEGAPTDARTDQFAWCVAAWEGLFGERPFAGASIGELMVAVSTGALREPARSRSVPRWLRRALHRGLAVEPAMRWPAMDVLLAELGRGQARVRTRTGVVVLGLLALAGVGADGWRRAERARKVAACEEAGASIVAVWPGEGGEARADVREALLASGVSYAATTAEKVQPWLDDYARAWQDARTQTCLRHDVEQSWDDDLRARADECLVERRGEIAALVTELARADAPVVLKAVAASAGLPRLEPCADTSALARRLALPAEQLENVIRVRDGLARAGALRRAGKYGDSVVAGEAALTEAEALGWPPLRAQARAALGSALQLAGVYDRAERELIAAYVDAGKAGATEIAQSAATDLLLVVGYRRAQYDDALLWAQLAEVELVRMGAAEDDLVAVPRLANLAVVHHVTGAYPEAKALFERALAIREEALGPDHPDVATSLDNLAIVSDATDAHAEAKALFERSLAISEKALGPDHPDVANSLNNLGVVYHATGAYSEAKAVHERAIAIAKKALGPDHPDLGPSLSNLANVHASTGEYAEAKALYERAIAIDEKTLGPDHPDVANSLNNLANVHASMGQRAPAQQLAERALAIREQALGGEHPEVAGSLQTLASLYSDASDYPRAKALLQRAVAIYDKNLGPDHPHVAYPLVDLAEILLAQHQPAEAVALLERALAIREANDTPARELAETRFALAQALWESQKDSVRALELARRAVDDFRTAGAIAETQLAAADAWLAKRQRP